MNIAQKLLATVLTMITLIPCTLDAMEPVTQQNEEIINDIAQNCQTPDRLVDTIKKLSHLDGVADLVKAGLDQAGVSLFDLKTECFLAADSNLTALHCAIKSCNTHVMPVLLAVAEKYGAGMGYKFILIVNGKKFNACHAAAECTHENAPQCQCAIALKILLDYANKHEKTWELITTRAQNLDNANVFHIAAMHGNENVLRIVLNSAGNKVKELLDIRFDGEEVKMTTEEYLSWGLSFCNQPGMPYMPSDATIMKKFVGALKIINEFKK